METITASELRANLTFHKNCNHFLEDALSLGNTTHFLYI